MKTIHVVAAAIVDSNQRVLIAKRDEAAHQGGLWEFPGGKVEDGETVRDALNRELFEELDIRVDSARPLILIQHNYPDKSVLLDVWLVDQFSGTAIGKEGQPVEWVEKSRLSDFEFPAANKPIVKAIQLPSKILITPEFSCDQRTVFFENLKVSVQTHQLKLVQVRAHQLSQEQYVEIAQQLIELAKAMDFELLWNHDADTVAALGESNLHLTSQRLSELEQRPAWVKNLSASCHTAGEIEKAEKLGCDFIFLSPVNSTATHEHATPLGWESFAQLANQAKVPVYALGGVAPDDLDRAFQCGAQGIAAIRAMWPHT